MDGTLLNAHNELSTRLLKQLNALKAQGNQLIIATGRTFGEVRTIVREGTFDFVICSNAMSIYNDRFEKLHAYTLVPSILDGVLRFASDHEIYYELRQDEGPGMIRELDFEYMKRMLESESSLTVSAHEWHARKSAISQLAFLTDEALQNAVKIYFFHPDPAKLANWRQGLAELLASEPISIESSSVNSCEIVHVAASKGNGLRYLENLGHIHQHEVICFGDSFNDLSMFDFAAQKVAMHNANDEVKRLADEVTRYSNEDDGIYHWLVSHIKE